MRFRIRHLMILTALAAVGCGCLMALQRRFGPLGYIDGDILIPTSQTGWLMIPIPDFLWLGAILAAPILGVVAWKRWRRTRRSETTP